MKRLYAWRVDGHESGFERGHEAALLAVVRAMHTADADAKGTVYPVRVTASGDLEAEPAVMRLWHCPLTGALLSDWD